jgi:hypothetical protein
MAFLTLSGVPIPAPRRRGQKGRRNQNEAKEMKVAVCPGTKGVQVSMAIKNWVHFVMLLRSMVFSMV